jgi:hypothetical protein
VGGGRPGTCYAIEPDGWGYLRTDKRPLGSIVPIFLEGVGEAGIAQVSFVAQIPSRFPDLQINNSPEIGIVGCQICQSIFVS